MVSNEFLFFASTHKKTMAKTMCKLAKELPDSLEKIIGIAENHAFICKKCGRVAHVEERLCKPISVK